MKAAVPFLLCLQCAVAQTSDVPAVRPDHPRLFFNRESWAAVKARAGSSERVGRYLAGMLEACDAYPADPPPCGNTGPVFTPPSEPIPNVTDYGPQAARCALAWRFSGERKYLEKARRMLARSIDGYREAFRNGRAVHWFSSRRILAFCAYDWIYEGLTPEERRMLIVPLVEHVDEIQPVKGGPRIVRRNCGGIETGFYGVSSLLWYSGLAAAGDGFCDELAARHLARGYELNSSLCRYRSDMAGDDGGLASGVPDYSMGAYPWAHFNFFHTLESATGRNPAELFPAMGLFPNWVWWNWIPTDVVSRPHCFGFGDDQHEQNFLNVRRLYEHMTQYMRFFGAANPEMARLAASLRGLAPNRELADEWPMYPFILPDESNVRPYPLAALKEFGLKARHFEKLGQFFMRSGWDVDSVYCLFTAGAGTMAHKHWDENNFVIYRSGFLALDSGSRAMETDTNLRYYYAQTVAHNCILVHKPNEPMPYHWGLPSDEPAAKLNDGGQYEGAAKVLAFETNPHYTYVASDAANVYGAKCREAVRQFVHLQPDVFVAYDRVAVADASYGKEWLLHAQREPVVSGAVARIDEGRGRLFCETLLPVDASIAKIGGKGREFWSNGKNWEFDQRFVKTAARRAKAAGVGPYFGNWRISVSPPGPSEEDRFLHVMTVGASTLAKPARAKLVRGAGCDAAEIEMPDGRAVRISFNSTGRVGGSIRIGGGEKSLAASVQPQSGLAGTVAEVR